MIGGDGVPCAGLDDLCAGADAYVQTVIREDLVGRSRSSGFLDILDYHSTVRQAAETAAGRRQGRSCSPTRCPRPRPAPSRSGWRRRPRRFGGEVVLGRDLTVVTV